MIKKLPFIFLLFTLTSIAQYSIKGSIDPSDKFSWVLLYKMQNGEQSYVQNADIVDGEFEFNLTEKEGSGIYRAYYQIENGLYVEFIYNDEDIEFNFDPVQPEQTLQFTKSDENNLHQKYYKSIRMIQKVVDSLQVEYFKSTDDKTDDQIRKKYTEVINRLSSEQRDYEKQSEGKLAHHIIKASAQYNSPEPIKNPAVYLQTVKDHFFDAIDLNDSILSHTSFINDRLTDYVFYLNQAEDLETINLLQQKAIQNAITWIGENTQVLVKFEASLLEQYLVDDNVTMLKFVLENYYNLLPESKQDIKLKHRVLAGLKTAVGVIASDFEWEDETGSRSLHKLTGTDYYIVLFFSSDCPHCQVETPEFYDFISGIENIQVVAVGLEDQKENWEQMTEGYDEFINILDLEKWSSPKVKDYGVMGIPSYFVLDSDKRILAKPEDFEELKSMFEEK
jgi:peroxiredoxin